MVRRDAPLSVRKRRTGNELRHQGRLSPDSRHIGGLPLRRPHSGHRRVRGPRVLLEALAEGEEERDRLGHGTHVSRVQERTVLRGRWEGGLIVGVAVLYFNVIIFRMCISNVREVKL